MSVTYTTKSGNERTVPDMGDVPESRRSTARETKGRPAGKDDAAAKRPAAQPVAAPAAPAVPSQDPATLRAKVAAAVAGAKALEHAAKDRVGYTVQRLPLLVRAPIKAAWAVATATYAAGNAAVQAVAVERGMPPDKAREFAGRLSAIDYMIAKPAAYAAHVVHATGAVAFVPWASVGYLATSSARNPLASIRAAARGVRAVIAAHNAMPIRLAEGDHEGLAAASAVAVGDVDWFLAAYAAACDALGGDRETALKVANAFLDENGTAPPESAGLPEPLDPNDLAAWRPAVPDEVEKLGERARPIRDDGDHFIIEGVPVLHRFGDMTEAEVRDYVDVARGRIDATADYPQLIPWHTPDDEERKAGVPDPPVIGRGQNPTFDPALPVFDRETRQLRYEPGIRMDLRFPQRLKAYALARNRRSAELVRRRRIIDPIAIMGGELPRLDLGPLTAEPVPAVKLSAAADDDPRVRCAEVYDLSAGGPALMTPEEIQQIVAALKADPGFVSMLTGQPPPGGMPPPAAPPAAPPAEGPPPAAKEGGDDEEKEKLRMNADETRIKLSQAQADATAARAKVAEIEAKLTRKEREADLIQLQAEGFEFDRAEELDAVVKLSDDAYTKHLARVRKLYKQAPVGLSIPVAGDDVLKLRDKGPPQPTQAQKDKAAFVANKERIPFAEALQKTMAATGAA